jgi:hypothetical protein
VNEEALAHWGLLPKKILRSTFQTMDVAPLNHMQTKERQTRKPAFFIDRTAEI